ncbi:glycosyltransferase family 2 protein [Rhodococcus sp. NPDC003383]
MKTCVVTIAAHRHRHLSLQLRGLYRGDRRPDRHVVVAMGDPGVASTVARTGSDACIVFMPHAEGPLPLAAARNLGADRALDLGAELLVFLDVDCIPAPGMLRRYEDVAGDERYRDALLCGPVTYLPPPPENGYDLDRLPEMVDPHPARPVPADDAVLPSRDHHLFWSLSFATTATTWRRLGGFCTDYTGYGGEDTDFGCTAARSDVELAWVGGAHAFHQYHPVSDPPVEHVHDIVTNATIFQRRWGWWPMRGWLDGFAELGLVRYDTRRGRWICTAAAR